MAGDVSCVWATWFRVHHRGYRRAPSTFDRARWVVRHTELLGRLEASRAATDLHVWREDQAAFRVPLSQTLILAGRPDLVAFTSADSATVYDVKTGKQRQSDVVQVMLYMLCLPAAYPALRDVALNGCVVYPDDEVIAIPAGAADTAFKRTARYFVDLLDTEAPPRRVPSPSECRFCDLTAADCHQRIEWIGPGSVLREAPLRWTLRTSHLPPLEWVTPHRKAV
jgi:hypothetical protein